MTTQQQWRKMMSRSFSPAQWFVTDERPEPNGGDDSPLATQELIRKMYVYRRTESGLWTVGYYDPRGEWHPESDWKTPEEAAARVRWLHGG